MQNKPNPATPDVYRHLGIILDKTLLNAPVIRTKIEGEGMISGGSMSDKEVETTVEVLNAGSLPAALNKTPISEDIISPTLGGVTVRERQAGDHRFAHCRCRLHDHLLPLCGCGRVHRVGT